MQGALGANHESKVMKAQEEAKSKPRRLSVFPFAHFSPSARCAELFHDNIHHTTFDSTVL